VISIASSLLVIAALFQIFDGTQAVGIGILKGLTDVKGPTFDYFCCILDYRASCGNITLDSVLNLGFRESGLD